MFASTTPPQKHLSEQKSAHQRHPSEPYHKADPEKQMQPILRESQPATLSPCSGLFHCAEI